MIASYHGEDGCIHAFDMPRIGMSQVHKGGIRGKPHEPRARVPNILFQRKSRLRHIHIQNRRTQARAFHGRGQVAHIQRNLKIGNIEALLFGDNTGCDEQNVGAGHEIILVASMIWKRAGCRAAGTLNHGIKRVGMIFSFMVMS